MSLKREIMPRIKFAGRDQTAQKRIYARPHKIAVQIERNPATHHQDGWRRIGVLASAPRRGYAAPHLVTPTTRARHYDGTRPLKSLKREAKELRGERVPSFASDAHDSHPSRISGGRG